MNKKGNPDVVNKWYNLIDRLSFPIAAGYPRDTSRTGRETSGSTGVTGINCCYKELLKVYFYTQMVMSWVGSTGKEMTEGGPGQNVKQPRACRWVQG